MIFIIDDNLDVLEDVDYMAVLDGSVNSMHLRVVADLAEHEMGLYKEVTWGGRLVTGRVAAYGVIHRMVGGKPW